MKDETGERGKKMRRVLGGILLGALLLGLGFSAHARWEAEAMARNRATLFLADGFHQCVVSVHANEALVFSGRVSSNDTIQYTATIPLPVRTSPFVLKIVVSDLAAVGALRDPVILERKIDCREGPYVTVKLVHGEELVLWQEATLPEFY